MKTLKDVIIKIEDLYEWTDSEEHFEFFEKSFGEEADLETILKKYKNKGMEAWLLYNAAYYLPNKRYIPEIVGELIKTGNEFYLYQATRYLPKSRRKDLKVLRKKYNY